MKLWVHGGEARKLYCFFCPGCGHDHSFIVRTDGERPAWSFDGNMACPTFSPSLRVLGAGDRTLCHLFVTAGKISYCGDSPHALAGQTVDMVDVEDE